MSTVRRTVIVGTGEIARWWVRPLLARPDVELVGLVEVDPARATPLLETFALELPVHNTVADAVSAERADLLVNLTPPSVHRPVCEEALALGCDVFVEKPLAESLADAEALVEAAARAGRTLVVMQNRRYLPAITTMRDLVADGAIGDVLHVCVDMFLWHQGVRDFLKAMRSPLLEDMAIHPFDAVRTVTGLEPLDVVATEWTASTSLMPGNAAAVCTWRLEGGAVFSYRGSWLARGLATTYDGVWRIGGTHGSITWDGHETVELERWTDVALVDAKPEERRTIRLEPPVDFGHTAALDAMLDALARGEQPATAAADNVASLAMVAAARRSAREGRLVTVEEVRRA